MIDLHWMICIFFYKNWIVQTIFTAARDGRSRKRMITFWFNILMIWKDLLSFGKKARITFDIWNMLKCLEVSREVTFLQWNWIYVLPLWSKFHMKLFCFFSWVISFHLFYFHRKEFPYVYLRGKSIDACNFRFMNYNPK